MLGFFMVLGYPREFLLVLLLWGQAFFFLLIVFYWLIVPIFDFRFSVSYSTITMLGLARDGILVCAILVLLLKIFCVLIILLGDCKFHSPFPFEQFLPQFVTICKLVITKKNAIFYLIILISYSIIGGFILIEQSDEQSWYYYCGCFMTLECIEFWLIFTDSFFIVCVGHLLYCAVLIVVILIVWWRNNWKEIHPFSWLGFLFGVVLIAISVWSFYTITGEFSWSISKGFQLIDTDIDMKKMQDDFYLGILLPGGFFPVCGLAFSNCKSFPINLRIFFNITYPIHNFIMLVHSRIIFGDMGFNYTFFIGLCLTIGVLTICIYFETKFMRILSLSINVHWYFLLLIYVLASTALRDGLVCDIWIHVLCILGHIFLLARYTRCYGEDITTAHKGLFYKYPLAVLLNITCWAFSERGMCRFLYQVYLDFHWTSEDRIFFIILLLLASCIVLYWVILLWRWGCLWFQLPKEQDIHNPRKIDAGDVLLLIYLVTLFLLSFYYPLIFYW